MQYNYTNKEVKGNYKC